MVVVVVLLVMVMVVSGDLLYTTIGVLLILKPCHISVRHLQLRAAEAKCLERQKEAEKKWRDKHRPHKVFTYPPICLPTAYLLTCLLIHLYLPTYQPSDQPTYTLPTSSHT